jgi:raffinose/stachyose/melibiose transport system substrate-binding protein
MAVTTSEDIDRGRLSSWSGMIDELSYGEGKKQRLIIISAGNIDDEQLWKNYPDSNLLSSIKNPGQSWNALTVGAHTEKIKVNDPRFKDMQFVAPPGCISPFSTTSKVWNKKWPIKPDIVFEGGNLLKDASGDLYEHEDLCILSTSKNIQSEQFDTFNATSSATAQASWFAAQVALKYPNAWPETLRGLIVHSASWNDEMIRQAIIIETGDYTRISLACSAAILFTISFTNSKYVDDISSITITNPSNVKWLINKQTAMQYWDKANNIEILYYKNSNPDFVLLGDYGVTIIDESDNESHFDIIVTNHGKSSSETAIYSHAIERSPSILGVPIIKKAAKHDNYLLVDFKLTDRLVDSCFILFYSDDKYLGSSDVIRIKWPESSAENSVSTEVPLSFKDANFVYIAANSNNKIEDEVRYRSYSAKTRIRPEDKSHATVVIKAMGYGELANEQGIAWKRFVESFESENPDVFIDYELCEDNAYLNRVRDRLRSTDIPHLVYMSDLGRWAEPWEKAGQRFDHRGFIDPKQYNMRLVIPMGPKGEIYEIPLGTPNVTSVLYMNIELIESLGFQAPKTYEDMIAMVPKARELGYDVVTIDGSDGWAWGACVLSCFIGRLSGDAKWVSKAVKGEVKFTDKEFVDSINLIERMVKDGVIPDHAYSVNYEDSIRRYSERKALFMVQGQWSAGAISSKTANNTFMIPWPKLPGEKENMAGSVAAVNQAGYGLTKSGASDGRILKAGIRFINYFNSVEEETRRFRNGEIVAPNLLGYDIPGYFPAILKEKAKMVWTSKYTEVIDAYLDYGANKALINGLIEVSSGNKKPKDLAAEVENLARIYTAK